MWQRISNLVDSSTVDCIARLSFHEIRVVQCITCNCDGAEYIYHTSSGVRVGQHVPQMSQDSASCHDGIGALPPPCSCHSTFCFDLSPTYAFGS
jgi:hypothetical protein